MLTFPSSIAKPSWLESTEKDALRELPLCIVVEERAVTCIDFLVHVYAQWDGVTLGSADVCQLSVVTIDDGHGLEPILTGIVCV